MISRLDSADLSGIDAVPVEVEVDVRPGMPAYATVGLPDAAVRESRERVKGALLNAGFEFPLEQITVNLAPADVRKEGGQHDLSIALGLLAATGQVAPASDGRTLFVGELALGGEVRAVRGVLAMALLASERGWRLACPAENAAEGAVVAGCPVYPVRTLREAADLLRGAPGPAPHPARPYADLLGAPPFAVDFAEVKGQSVAKRALEVAAAGAHNALLLGPPGSGKSMLAKRLPTILPPMTFEEALETTRVHSARGERRMMADGIVAARPFRSPHHTVSFAGMIGGGVQIQPGEISMAHNGVLFLDELTEFKRDVLECLRQPLEDRRVTISRARGHITFPASFTLLAASNPCPCGYYGDPVRRCRCTPLQIRRYLSKISGPLLDRTDIQLEVAAVPAEDLRGAPEGERSATVRDRVVKARQVQWARFEGAGIHANAQMDERAVERFCALRPAAEKFLLGAQKALGITARGHHRILKVARTIADLEGSSPISEAHLAEAVQYRGLDRKLLGEI